MKLHKNSVALVTGAARGLGWGIARAFGIAGARVGVTDIRDDELARCARDLAADGADFQTFRSDVADLAACKDVVRKIVDRCGRIDVDRKSTRLNSSHTVISYAVFCLK